MKFETIQEAIEYEMQLLKAVGEIPLDRLRELAEADRKGKIKIGSDWTPCAEGLPESDRWCDDGFRKTYRVTVEADAGKLSSVLGNPYRYVTTASFELGKWILDSEDDEFDESEKVIAWMDQPEPYNHGTAKED